MTSYRSKAKSLVSEVPVLQDSRGYHGPQVDSGGKPARDNLDPHGGGVSGVGGDAGLFVRLVP